MSWYVNTKLVAKYENIGLQFQLFPHNKMPFDERIFKEVNFRVTPRKPGLCRPGGLTSHFAGDIPIVLINTDIDPLIDTSKKYFLKMHYNPLN